MKSIKLKTEKSIRGVPQKSGTVLTVTTVVSEINDDKSGLTIGILCAEDLIRRGDAEQVAGQSKPST